MIIRDPSTGNGMEVTNNFRASVSAVASNIQNFISLTEQQAYILGGQTSWTTGTGERVIVYVENTSTDLLMVITRAVLYVITDLTLPDTGSFFTTGLSGNYASGGTLVTPVNEHVGSPNSASVIAYNANPSINSVIPSDIIHPVASGTTLVTGASTTLVIEPTQSIQMSFTPSVSHTGTAYARINFYMVEA